MHVRRVGRCYTSGVSVPPARMLYLRASPDVLLGLLVSVLVVFLAAGCAAVSRSRSPALERPTAAAPPTWYLAPPEDTEHALYGVGSASTLPVAKSVALVDVASKLMISVQSTQWDRMVLRNDQLDQHIESELVTHVRDREFQAYDVVGSALSNGMFYALVRVDRGRLVRDTLDGLRELRRDFTFRLDPAANGTSLAYYIAFREVEPSLRRAEASVELLSMLSPDFDPAPYLTQHGHYRDRYERARGRVVVALMPDGESEPVVDAVQELLSSAGMQSEVFRAESGVGDACRDVCIEIASEWSGRYAARRYMAVLTATFRVRDAAGSVASARQHQVRASALASDEEARLAAVDELREALEREGILQAVGLTPEPSAGPFQSAVTN